MKKSNAIIKICMCLLPIVIGIILYNKLPDMMRISFGWKSYLSIYVPKRFVLFWFPVAMTLVQLVVLIVIQYRSKGMSNVPKLLIITGWIIPFVTLFVYYLTVSYALNEGFNIWKNTCLMVGILFCVLGNYFPKMSYESGKKLIYPAPKDEVIFKKMMKLCGYFLMGAGITLLVIMLII